jgi:hypothetical protein
MADMSDFDQLPPRLSYPDGFTETQRASLDDIADQVATLAAEASELHNRVTRIYKQLGELMAGEVRPQETIVGHDQLSMSEEVAVELPTRDALAFVEDHPPLIQVEHVMSNDERGLRNSAREKVEPFFATFSELLKTVSAPGKYIAPAPVYTENLQAWNDYVTAYGIAVPLAGRRIKVEDGEVEHAFALTYLPLKEGNRLATFTASTVELRRHPYDKKAKDEIVTEARFAFDGTELVEATLSGHTNFSAHKSARLMGDVRKINLGFGRPASMADFRLRGAGGKLREFVYDPSRDAFVDAKATGNISR